MRDKHSSWYIKINGIVQGVGFRPHVYRLACEYELKGWVLNSSSGVFIEVEGDREKLKLFARRLVEEPPPLALIRSCEIDEIEFHGYKDFSIRESDAQDDRLVMISPDIAICDDCKREVLEPADRRYLYPFINCTNCGPRFTIIKDVPYDRAMTTMAPFPMCPRCQEEYDNPLDRRFHAQPNACPLCGPHISLLDKNGQEVETELIDLLKQGYIVAVKGLGGFHLAVDARNAEAVERLRRRKRRDAKPFALMARDLGVAGRYCDINSVEEKCLLSPQAPIVVMKSKNCPEISAELIHPGLNTLGIMLPYTPLHFLLFDNELDLLVMTSANISDEPLIIDNDEAVKKLSGVADYFLIHNREIFNPCDDSVITVSPLDKPQFFRRARGYVPQGIKMPVLSSAPVVLALGSEMKNTFCMTRQGEAFMSQHWGDLNHYNNYRNFLEGIERFKRMLAVQPELLAHDLHPNHQATRWAKSQTNLEIIGVQHHHAHLAAAMAENSLEGEVLGLICDGTGWGTDGAIWGCEIFKGGYQDFTRLGHLKYLPLPGGDLSSRKPYRMAFVYLFAALGQEGIEMAEKLLPDLPREERDILLNRLNNEKAEIMTSSCGRLFDAVASILGICNINNYEGQAAIELEARANPGAGGRYSYLLEEREDSCLINVLPMLPQLIADKDKGVAVDDIAQKFHLSMADVFYDILSKMRDKTGLNRVVLSGGTFHNQILLSILVRILEKNEFKVYQHQQVPPGDGGISLGQAIIASEVKCNVSGCAR